MLISIGITLSIFFAAQESNSRPNLQAVDSIPVLGTPGTMSVWGEDAFAVVVGNDVSQPVAAAATYGEGRFFAIAHGSYVSGMQQGEPSTFMQAVAKWVGQKENPVIATLSNDISNWGTVDVLMFGQNMQLTTENEKKLLQWIHDGGGVIASACPWGWVQVTGNDLSKDLSQNRVMASLGMQYGGNYATAGTNGKLHFDGIPAETHAAVALQMLRDTQTCTAVGSNAILYSIQSAPDADHSFIDAVRSVLTDCNFVAPTETHPLQSTDVSSRLYAALFTHEWKSGKTVVAAQGSEIFPGRVEASIARVTKTISLTPIEQGWQSTGLYLNAGERAHCTIAGGNADGWTIRIGCHSDVLWSKGSWQRWPEITHVVPLSNDLSIATPWGGLLYFIPSKYAQPITVTIDGVIEAPLFDVANEQQNWIEERNNPAPWAELKGEYMVVTVPSASIRSLEDPKAVTDFWDEVNRSHCELAGVTPSLRLERFVADQQISAGYMHSGYPIMTWLDVATPKNGKLASVVDVEFLKKYGSWGHFHELGHNRQRGWWTFAGTGEVTCNLFSLHAGEVLCGIEPWENPWLQGQIQSGRDYLESGADFSKWKQSPGIALISYAQIQKEFGWSPFTTVFKAYERMPNSTRPTGNQDKMDEWVRRISVATERDLRPFYLSWGMPLSETLMADETLNAYKTWIPEPL